MTHPAYGVLRAVSAVAAVLLENNPSNMTLDGTNSWVLGARGSAAKVVVDPGYDDLEHLRLLEQAAPIELIVLTHFHPDHAQGAPRLAEWVGAPVRAFDPALCRDAAPLHDGEVLDAAGLAIEVLHTPGHTADSVSLRVEDDGSTTVLTGDTVLGFGTTVLSDLGAYLGSLQVLRDLPPGTLGLPGHGEELTDLAATARGYAEHREQRLEQVRAALEALGHDATARQIVELVYANVDPALWGPAEASVRAQLDYLHST